MTQELWTKEMMADFYKVSVSTVESWLREGRIKFVRTPGGAPRFLPPTIEPEYRKVEDTVG